MGIWEVPNSNLGQDIYNTEYVCVVQFSNRIHLPSQYVDQAIMRLPSKFFAICHTVIILPSTLYRLRYSEIYEINHKVKQ